ncbi:hypothetical protein [Mesohalobacter halotolerans]|uniref:Uncharacterized protein n=1 Tax=Mesohalobacter halotolerans TaxID=1883405 RepID=A0A4U5TV72_9FLAO|nr:hypothetical protein [Mesohalobacter halotolerans]TKS57188.1 hypothetical protein FCN74_01865 [Mesohalobacter halotolerans]
MKYCISNIKPDPFMSVGVESYRLKIFGVNILIGIIIFFFRKRLSILFFANTIICYWIFLFFWNSWIENHPYSSTEYSFQIENRKFVLGIERNPNTFGIDEVISELKDSLITVGMHKKVGDSLKLTSMQETMYFYNNTLSGFSQSPNAIELNKIE